MPKFTPPSTLRLLRIRAGLRQRDLAAALNPPRCTSFISQRELGDVPISKADARALARVLHVKVGELLGEVGR